MADNVSIKRTYKNHQYTYNNSGTGLSENKPIDPYIPEEELLSEDYIQHVLTSDLVSLDAARGKIPISDPTTGRLRMSWIADQMATTTLPIASEAEAKDPNNNDSVMTPKTTHIAIHDVVKDATTTRKGIVQLTDSLTQSVLNRSDLAITPLALKNYLAASGGFSHAGYNDAFGITAYASDMDVNGILSYSKTNTNATLRNTDLYNDYSITPYTLYNYVSNNDLTLNTGKNIVFSSRAINGSTTAPTDIGKISVDRANKTMTVMVNDKNITIANTGNVTFPGEITATKINGPATKLTTTSAGSSSKYVYFSNGIPVVSTSNIGSETQPVYVVNGELKPATSVPSIKVNNATAADKLNVSNTGTATKLTYFSNGVPVASASNVGDANTPVYLDAGSIKSTGKSFANYLPLAGGTMTGALNFANNTLNTIGDDIKVGDGNVAGQLVMQGINGNTGITMLKTGDANTKAGITFDGTNIIVDKAITGTISTASTANKLGSSNKGTSTTPIYLVNGTPTACGFTVETSVPANAKFTDTNDKVAVKKSTSNNTYPLLIAVTANASADIAANYAYFGTGIKANPSTSAITATTFNGDLSGNAATATTAATASKTAKTLTVKKDSNNSVTFNGSADVSIDQVQKAKQLADSHYIQINIKHGSTTYTGKASFNGTGDCTITLTV